MRRAFKPFAFLAAIVPALLPREAAAEVVIAAPQTTAVTTSGAGDNVRVSTAGQVTPASGIAVNVNSNNTLNNEGLISIVDAVTPVTGVQLTGGFTGSFTNSGLVGMYENYNYVDSDNDGDLDGPFANGSDRVGVRVTGASPFIGNITETNTGLIQVEGNNSAAILIEGQLNGNLSIAGGTSAVGTNSFGIRSTAPINGNVLISGNLSAQGSNAHGVSLENTVTGAVRIDSTLTANGFRFTARPTDAVIANLDADDKLQGGSALRVLGNVTGGVFINTAPADLDTLNTDEDGDGILDSTEGNGALQAFGAAPALKIGDALGPAITVGNVGTGAYAYGLVNQGTINTVSLLDGYSARGAQIENVNLSGGFLNSGTVLGGAFEETGTGVLIGTGAIINEIKNTSTGTFKGVMISDSALFKSRGLMIQSGATVPLLTNAGEISAQINGEAGDGVAITDASNSLAMIVNSGQIFVSRTATDGATDTDDADNDPSNEVITGRDTAIDLSSQLISATVRQVAPALSTAAAPRIIGDVRFGTGGANGDTLDLQAGILDGNVYFGGGVDSLLISGGSKLTGKLNDTDSNVAINVSDGTLSLENTGVFSGGSLTLGSTGKLELTLDPVASQNASLNLSGNANFVSGSAMSVLLKSASNLAAGTPQVFNLVTAGSITGSPNVSLANAPFLYSAVVGTLPTTVDLTLTRKTATQLGLNKNQSAMYEPFFSAALTDPTLMQSVLGLGTSATFLSAYDQVLPNAAGGQVELASTRSQALTSSMFARYLGPVQTNREVYAWAHELSYSRNRDSTFEGQGIDGFGFGFAAGVDGPMGKSGYKGFGLLFSGDEVDEQNGLDKPMTSTSIEGTVHAVQPFGKMLVAGRIGAGYDHFKSTRIVAWTPDLASPAANRKVEGDWNGGHVDGSLRAAYMASLGKVNIRPEVGIDGVALWEQGYDETGGGTGLNLSIDSRTSMRANASAALNVGMSFVHRGFVLNPELTVGVRQPLVNDAVETNAHFVGSTTNFTLTGDTVDEPAVILGGAFTVDGEIGSLRFEAQAEDAKGDTSASGRVVLRLTF